MTDPNANATPQSVADALDGTLNGQRLEYRLVDMLRTGTIRDLETTTVFPEGENTSSSVFDQIVTLAKILTRRFEYNGQLYDIWDMVATVFADTQAAKAVTAPAPAAATTP